MVSIAQKMALSLGLSCATLGPCVAAGQDAPRLPEGMLITCALRPLQEISVNSVIPGIVAEVFVAPGQHVKAGDPLVRLDTTFAENDVIMARQRAEFTSLLAASESRATALETRYKRLERAYDNKAISRDQYETALLDFEQARADATRQRQEIELARADLVRAQMVVAQSTINSPATAVVGADLIDPSESTSNQPIVTLFVTERLRAEAYVPLGVFPTLEKAKSFSLVIGGDRTNAVPTEIDYVAPLADLSSGTISVFFQIDGTKAISGEKCGLDIK